VKDDEFEGDEQVQKAMKGMLPPLLDGMPSRHKIAPEISLCPSTRSKFTWLEPLPVTQEAAGSSPVAPAISCF
jgi:hypothetical protein